MSELPPHLEALIESGPMAHLSTINADGSPQVTVIWIGLDGADIVSAHMSHKRLVKNIERDGRAVLSFQAPAEPGAFCGRTPRFAQSLRSSSAMALGSC